MLLQYFGFREDPFGVTPDSRFLYETSTHCEALASLKYGFLSSRGFVAMVAPPGMGKTTILMKFLQEIRESARTVFLFDVDPNCAPSDFISYVLRDLGIVPGENSAEMHEQLRTEVAAEAQAGRSFVVVIDEAQNLSETSLEVIRTLTNFETARSKLIQVVLAGQPQLAEKLNRPSLEQLRQRITTFCRIEPLSMQQRVPYIEHRLRFAGYNGPALFTQDALQRIAEASEGTPRVINTLCWNALSLCSAMKRRQVDAAMVAEVLADLLIPAPSANRQALLPTVIPTPLAATAPSPQPAARATATNRWAAVAAILLLTLFLSVFGVVYVRRQSVEQHAGQTSDTAVSPVRVAGASQPELQAVPKRSSIEVVVRRNESLRDLSLAHLGEFNRKRVQEIMKLNPELTDPNLILEGQTIVLPAPE